MSLRRRVVAALAVGLALAVSGCQGACSSAVLAPEASDAERARLAAVSFPVAIAVDAGRFPPVYGERLAEALRAAGLFARVDLGAARSDAPLVATVTAPSEGAAVIPIATALTLGFFPTWAEETWGLAFEITGRDAAAAPVAIDFRWRGTTFLGWLSALLNLSPGRGPSPDAGERYAEHVAATIAPHAEAITALAAASR